MGRKCNIFTRFLPIVVSVLILGFFLANFSARAQGTALSIEDVDLTVGDTTTLYITLDEAIDGLGRFDASLISSQPEVLELVSIAPEAISEQFLQVDSENKGAIKFKLVDLGKKIAPGDENVQLLSVDVKAIKEGEAELSFEGIKYTDEDGDVIEPEVKPGTITVKASAPQETETQEAEEKPEEEKLEEGEEKEEQPPAEEEEKEEEEKEPEGEKEKTYLPRLEELKLKLGKKGRVGLEVSSLPEGLRIAQAWIISSGEVGLERVSVQNPSYFTVVKHTKNLLSFRVGDFDGQIGPGTGKLTLAEIQLKATQVGEARLRTKLTVWTDQGERIERQGEPAVITVGMGSIGASSSPPQDLDGDSLYEDVNGDGELSEEDAFALAFNLDSASVKDNPSLFDFNWDGEVSFEDTVELIRKLGD